MLNVFSTQTQKDSFSSCWRFRPMYFYTVLKPQIHIASTQHTATCPTLAQYCYWAVSSTIIGMTGFIHMPTYLFYLTFQNSSVLAIWEWILNDPLIFYHIMRLFTHFIKLTKIKIFLTAILSHENVAGTFRNTKYSFHNTKKRGFLLLFEIFFPDISAEKFFPDIPVFYIKKYFLRSYQVCWYTALQPSICNQN